MSDLKVTGKITSILDVETGTSKAGKEWQKQSFVIDTEAKFNPEVCFSLFGEKTDLLSGLKTGDEVEVSFNVSSREFKDASPQIYFISLNEEQNFEPKLQSRKLNDGSLLTPELHDMFPFLSKEEIKTNLII